MENHHSIKTITDIMVVVNASNVDNFLKDLKTFILATDMVKSFDPNVECTNFTWIDDGEHNVTVNFNDKKQ